MTSPMTSQELETPPRPSPNSGELYRFFSGLQEPESKTGTQAPATEDPLVFD